MNDAVLNFTASSPEQLRTLLAAQSAGASSSVRFATLAISGPQVLVRTFQFEQSLPLKELKKRLLLETVELLSLPVEDVKFTFQILNTSEGKVNGIYICLPKKLLYKYLWVLRQAGYIPITVTASLAAHLNGYLKDPDNAKGRLCFLDFSKERTIGLTVIAQNQCELIREVPYENWTEAKNEVMQSLRSVCAKSAIKNFTRIYMIGEKEPREDLVRQIENDFHATVEQRPAIDLKAMMGKEMGHISLNLIQEDFGVSLNERRLVLKIFQITIVALIGVCILLGVKINLADRSIHNIKNSYKPADYQYALELQAQIEASK